MLPTFVPYLTDVDMKLLSCFCLMALPSLAFGQPSFTFKTAFYLTDAVGHADTVWLYGDTIMVNNTPDTAVWRGVSVEQADAAHPFQTFLLPWYDVLYGDPNYQEALLHGFEPERYYRQLVIDAPGGMVAEPVFWLFKTNHFPVTVRWEHWSETALETAVWLPDHGTLSQPDAIPGEDYPLQQYCCMKGQTFCNLNPTGVGNMPGAAIFGFIQGTDGPLSGALLTPLLNQVCTSGLASTTSVKPVRIFPNPTRDSWCIELPAAYLPASVRVEDWLGRPLYERTMASETECFDGPLPGNAGACCLLVIDSQNVTIKKRLVIVR